MTEEKLESINVLIRRIDQIRHIIRGLEKIKQEGLKGILFYSDLKSGSGSQFSIEVGLDTANIPQNVAELFLEGVLSLQKSRLQQLEAEFKAL